MIHHFDDHHVIDTNMYDVSAEGRVPQKIHQAVALLPFVRVFTAQLDSNVDKESGGSVVEG